MLFRSWHAGFCVTLFGTHQSRQIPSRCHSLPLPVAFWLPRHSFWDPPISTNPVPVPLPATPCHSLWHSGFPDTLFRTHESRQIPSRCHSLPLPLAIWRPCPTLSDRPMSTDTVPVPRPGSPGASLSNQCCFAKNRSNVERRSSVRLCGVRLAS